MSFLADCRNENLAKHSFNCLYIMRHAVKVILTGALLILSCHDPHNGPSALHLLPG